MARVLQKTSNPRKSKGTWGAFEITTEWDTMATESLLSRTLRAVSGPSLAAWLTGPVDMYFKDDVIERFAFEGDNKSGDWAPLTETTERIRDALGFPPSDPINERTGELLDFVLNSREYMGGDDWAGMNIPGDPDSAALEAKMIHAQQGAVDNALFPGATTPPRPVLAVDPTDMALLLQMLQMHVINFIAVGL